MMTKNLLLLTVVLTLIGCSEQSLQCHRDFDLNGDDFCAYASAAITIEGFRCPAEFPKQTMLSYEFGDFIVCTEEGVTPDDNLLEPEIQTRFGVQVDAGVGDLSTSDVSISDVSLADTTTADATPPLVPGNFVPSVVAADPVSSAVGTQCRNVVEINGVAQQSMDDVGVLFDRICGPSCHGSESTSVNPILLGVDLTEAGLAMVGSAPELAFPEPINCPDRLMINAEDIEASFLLEKVDPSLLPRDGCGDLMPRANELTDEERLCMLGWAEDIVAKWRVRQ